MTGFEPLHSGVGIDRSTNWATTTSHFQLLPVWPEKNHQMCIKVAPKMISLEKWKISTPLQNLPKNVGDLGKVIVSKGFKKMLKVQ